MKVLFVDQELRLILLNQD